MKPKQLALGAIVAILLASATLSTTANAQGRVVCRQHLVIVYRHYNPFWYRYYDPFWSPFPSTYTTVDPIVAQREEGFSNGRSKGKKDAKKGLPNAPTSHKEYSKSNSLAYREAFLKGYAEGYRYESNKTGD